MCDFQKTTFPQILREPFNIVKYTVYVLILEGFEV